MESPLPLPAVLAFAGLTMSLASLWASRLSPRASQWWMWPFAAALIAALASGLIDTRGLGVVLLFALACAVADRATAPGCRFTAHGVALILAAGLMLHRLPGFHNPVALSNVVLGPGSEPYTKYLNFDKGIVGLFILGLYAPDLTAHDLGVAHARAALARFALVAALTMTATPALGYVRWDPKVPEWWPLWAWSMVFLTALPEEALFRGVVQTWLERRLSGTAWAGAIAAAISGTLLGLAHANGGPAYIALATIAGMGYGWIYRSTQSIGLAIAAHSGLNAIHLVFFSYPALALHR